MDCLHCCSMHTYAFGIWIWCCLFHVLSYTSLLPQSYRFLRQSTVHTYTAYPLIWHLHPPLIHHQFGLILTFVFLLMIWSWAFFFFFFNFLAFLAFVSGFRFLLYIWHTGFTSSDSCQATSSFWKLSSQLSSSSHPVETSEILSGMFHLVLLGFRYASSQNKKVYALSSLLAVSTTADDVPDLLTFFSSSLCFKYLFLTLSKKFRGVSPKITKNKEGLICAQVFCLFDFASWPPKQAIVIGT